MTWALWPDGKVTRVGRYDHGYEPLTWWQKMTWDWRKVVSSVFRPKEYIRPVCPVCHEKLNDIPGSDAKECKNGHRFGPAMERADLINEGDHRGDL